MDGGTEERELLCNNSNISPIRSVLTLVVIFCNQIVHVSLEEICGLVIVYMAFTSYLFQIQIRDGKHSWSENLTTSIPAALYVSFEELNQFVVI